MYYRTYSDTRLIRYGTYQIQNLSDTGLIRYKSTRRYYRTYSDIGLIRYRTYQIQEYPWVLQDLFRYRTYQIQDLSDTGVLIRTSRRSYKVSSYAELILITDVCSFGTPVGVTELNQIQEYP